MVLKDVKLLVLFYRFPPHKLIINVNGSAMKNLNQLIQLRRVHQFILHAKTGTPKEFAKKMNVSERTLFRLLDYLKEIEAPICYDKKVCTYYYDSPFELRVQYCVEVLKDNELIKIQGGISFLQKNKQTAILWQ